MTQLVNNLNLDLQLRYAHIDGHTEFDFIPNKNEIITTGADCEVRLWSLDSENDGVQTSFTVEDVPYSILATNDRSYVALASNSVKSFQLDEAGEDETLVCRFTSNATCLSFHPDKELLAIGAADFTIKLINLVDQSTKTYEGHEGPILSVSIDPLRKYLASSACDGSVHLWSLETKTIHHKWIKIFPKSNDFENSQTLCRICWEPKSGECLVIPRENRIEIYKREQWDNPYLKVQHPEMCGFFSIACFSNDGLFLAASTTQSIMAIWKMNLLYEGKFNPISMLYNVGNLITCLKFNPRNPNQLCCVDNCGLLRIMKIRNENNNEIKSPKVKVEINQSTSQKTMEEILADFEIDNDDDFNFQIEENNKETFESVEKIESVKVMEKKNEKDHFSDSIDDQVEIDEEFDISVIKSKYEPLIFGDNNEKQQLSNNATSLMSSKLTSTSEFVIDGYRITGSDLLSLIRGPRYQAPIRQSPFQSGSTPTHYQNRFMVWNSIGIVYSYNTENERSIDVEFHDTTFFHSIHMVNMFNYTMGDLSTSCLLLASNGDDESDDELDHLKGRMFCLIFNTWDQVKEWQIDLPKDELFDCITAGHTFIAAVTNLRYLRIWTIGGIQTMIRSIDGPSINLSSYDNFLMVLYHSASQHAEDGESVACVVLKVDHKGKTRAHPIPTPISVSLSPKTTINWAGFTDEGTPCVVDSDGIIRVYKTHFGNGWFPICATKQHANGKSDNFFIIGLSEIQSHVRCIFCKASRYPDTVPKPTLTVLPLQIPLCELNDTGNAKAKHEEEWIRSCWLASLLKRLSLDGYDVEDSLNEAEKHSINSLIKLFALALGAERESLALEIAKLLPNSKALEGAIRYAERQRHRSLAMKLIEMIQDEDQKSEDEINSDVELQELMNKKNSDRLRQILKDEENKANQNMISLVKCDSESNNFTILKPKSMKKSIEVSDPAEPIIEDDDEEENPNGDEEIQLCVKKIESLSKNQKNPFKVHNKKRKQLESSSEDDSELKDRI